MHKVAGQNGTEAEWDVDLDNTYQNIFMKKITTFWKKTPSFSVQNSSVLFFKCSFLMKKYTMSGGYNLIIVMSHIKKLHENTLSSILLLINQGEHCMCISTKL